MASFEKNPNIIQKHRDVIIFHKLLIRHLGEKARQMTRKSLYDITASAFYVEGDMVMKIISKLGRFRIEPNRAEILEFKDRIKFINEVCNQVST